MSINFWFLNSLPGPGHFGIDFRESIAILTEELPMNAED